MNGDISFEARWQWQNDARTRDKTKVNVLTSASEMVLKFIELCIMLVETTHLTQVE